MMMVMTMVMMTMMMNQKMMINVAYLNIIHGYGNGIDIAIAKRKWK